MSLTKSQLEQLNNSSFPNNNAGYITPEILRTYNSSSIAATVNQNVYTVDSASVDLRLDNLENFSSSLVTNFATVAYVNGVSASLTSTASFNQYTQSTAATIAGLATTASVNAITQSVSNISTSVGLLQTFSGSQYKADSASFSSRIISAENTGYVTTASFNSYTQSTDTKINSLNTISASYLSFTQSYYSDSASFDSRIDAVATTGSNTFNGNQIINGNVSASSFVSASKFIGDGSQLTGITASVSIAILDEGVYQGNATSLNFTGSGLTASVVAGVATIVAQVDQSTLNQYTLTSSFNAFSQSYVTDSASFDSRIDSITVDTSSLVTTASFNAYTASQDFKNTTFATTASVNTLSSSIFQTDSTQSNNINSLTLKTGSYATTGSNTFVGNQTINGDISASGNISASSLYATNATIINLTTIYETSSVIYSSGSNQLGDELTDVQILSGSVKVVGGLTLNGVSVSTQSVDISSLNAFTASQYVSNSYFATTGSNTFNGNQNITGSLTASGLKYPSVDNGEKSFIQTDGNGNLSLQYVDTIFEAFYAGESVLKGTPLYFSGSQGANPIAYAADASNPNKMPVIVVANENLTAGTTYEGIVLGLIEGIDLTGYTAGQTVYVAEGGGWSTSLPSGSNSITQVLGIVTKGGSGGKGLVLNPGPAQLPGLVEGYVWVGNSSNQPIAVATSSFIEDLSGYTTTASFNSYTSSQDFKNTTFATTGSNTFIGNQSIEGNLYISSSNTSDVIVNGQIFVSSSATSGASALPKITVSGSNGTSTINRNSITTRNADNQAALNPQAIYASILLTSDEIGFSVDPSGFPNWTFGPGIYVNDTTDSYPAIFGFQDKANYTDGRVTVLTPLVVSAGIIGNTIITGSLILSSSNAVELNVIGNSIITGSLILSSSVPTELQVIGGVEITGSVAGNITALTVASSTASIDFNLGTFFTLTIPSSSVTYITGSNLKPGMTANIVLTQQSTTGSVRFESSLFKFPSGSINTGSAVASAVDLVSVMSVNTTTLLSVGANRLI